MKKQTALIVMACFAGLLSYRCTTSTKATPAADSTLTDMNVYGGFKSQPEWGSHLVAISGCNDCHTSKKMTDKGPVDDTSVMLAGHFAQGPVPQLLPDQVAKGMGATYDLTAWHGPWGHSYAANLTPDSTGIGEWTEEQFINCLRKGIFKGIEGSRPLMPPMPVAGINNMTDDELKAVFAYLKTVKPVHNVVPDYQPPATH